MKKKALILAGCALLAAAVTMEAPTAEAGFRGSKFRGGALRIGRGLILHRHHRVRRHRFRRHHFRRRHIIVTPVYKEKVARPPVIREKVVIARYEDGMGRVYDVASKVWHDGESRCWSGSQAWTFRSGSWFYGSHRWTEADGAWRTAAPDAPVETDCASVPAFAAKVAPKVTQSSGSEKLGPKSGPIQTAEQPQVEPASIDLPGGKAGECKRYVPSLGKSLPVPCRM